MPARIELGLDDATVVLALDEDAAATRRAWLHAAGHAVVHVGPLPPALEPLARAIARGLTALPPTSTTALAAQVATIARGHAPAVRVAIVLAAALPRWSSRLRTGMPPRPSGRPGARLWPFDPELIGLLGGHRTLVKRECFSDAAEADDRAWLAAAKVPLVRVGPVEPDGRRVLLGALDPGAITADLTAAELAVRRGHDLGAARTLGRALGYPSCCIEAFLDTGGHDDHALIARLAAGPMPPPASPLTVWLNQPLALVSHVPCTLACAPTRALAAALLADLDRAVPGFADGWRALAARVHVLDHRGRGLALTGTGDLARGLTITDAVAFVPAPDDALGEVVVAAPEAVGRTITRADVAAAADHRG
ncbi:MAG: hypothetical protein IPL61_03925 [Myxococcales bacterium]|nr:hypothetical protein [Myxococcales bacterium]